MLTTWQYQNFPGLSEGKMIIWYIAKCATVRLHLNIWYFLYTWNCTNALSVQKRDDVLDCPSWLNRGARYLTGENLKCCLGRVFNYKFDRTAILYNSCNVYIQPLLKLKTRPRFSHVSLSLSMAKASSRQNCGLFTKKKKNFWSVQGEKKTL